MDEVAFLKDQRTQDAVIRNIEIIGEASNNIRKDEPSFVENHSEVSWGFAVGMRNVLSHVYFKADLEAVW